MLVQGPNHFGDCLGYPGNLIRHCQRMARRGCPGRTNGYGRRILLEIHARDKTLSSAGFCPGKSPTTWLRRSRRAGAAGPRSRLVPVADLLRRSAGKIVYPLIL